MKSQKFLLLKIGVLIIMLAVFIKHSVPVYSGLLHPNAEDISRSYRIPYYESKRLLADGKKEEALKAAQEAVRYQPKVGKVYLQLGYVHFKLDNYDEAEKYYLMSLKYSMKHANKAIAHNNIGVLYHQKFSFYDKAVDHYSKSFELLTKEERNSLRIDPLGGLVEVLVYSNQFELAKQLIVTHGCETPYCQWLDGIKQPLVYPPIPKEKLTTRVMSIGAMRVESQYKQDVGLHGFSFVYAEDGSMMMEQYYRYGKLNGSQKVYYGDGKLLYEKYYHEGKLLGKDDQPLTGTHTTYHPTGTVSEESQFVDGLQHGLTKVYSDDKSIISESMYEDGHPSIVKFFYKTGELRSETDFNVKNGLYNRTFHENGTVKSEQVRDKNRIISDKIYDESGKYLGDRYHADIESIKIVQAGVFKEISQTLPPNFCIMKMPRYHPGMIEAADRLPATLNIKFGIAYTVHGQPDEGRAEVLIKFIHPPLTNPKTGKTSSTDEITDYAIINETQTAAWIFEEVWEMVPGQWTIQIFNKDKKLAEKTFIVDDMKQQLSKQ